MGGGTNSNPGPKYIYPTSSVVVKAVKKHAQKGGGDDGWGLCVVLIKAIREAHLTGSPSLEQRPEGAREPGRQVSRGRGFRCKGPGAGLP